MAKTGQWFSAGTGQRFWFDTGSVAIDFAYTGGFDQGGETLNEPAALVAWLQARFAGMDAYVSETDLIDAKSLRASIAHLAVAASRDLPHALEDIDVVNLYAAMPDIPPSLAGGSRRAGRTSSRPSQGLAAIAREAIELFSPRSEERIRECAADDCELVFYDESRSNNRRWCSMQRCGNRAKVRAHRRRTAMTG